jgi:cysteinyl-tRNA synthetase
MSLRIYNTLSRAVEEFSPLEPGHVRMYVCGMTIYDLCHIGHARMMMAFDVVQRWFKASGLRVTYVRNITDIDDKIIKRAVERGITIRALTDEMIQAMHQDIGALGMEPPSLEPRATEYVPQMLGMIATLEEKGLAYRAPGGDMNYAVRKFPGYGKLSGKSLDELRAGERVAVLDGKEDPLDFVLWKSAKPTEPDDAKWDSDYGPGRPGWHIECSAMSCQTLGETFDLHGGGADLQFPHHENEIAQSEGANGKPLARFWVHNGFVRVDNEKMSKSLGNFFTIREVLTQYDAETIRFFLVRTHYRSALNYSDAHLDDARNALKRLYTALAGVTADAVAIDWNHPLRRPLQGGHGRGLRHARGGGRAVRPGWRSQQDTLACAGGTAQKPGRLPGPAAGRPGAYLQAGAGLDEASIQGLIAQRAAAKAAKNFAEADRIRQDLLAKGIVLKDSAAGTTWEAQS